MLTKKEVEKLICHRFWIHKAVTEENNFILIFMGDASASGFLVIQFETNGEITFPTHLGFQPGEYARWDFDEEKQEILFFDKNNNISNRGSLPTKWINDDHIIQLLNGNNGILVDDSNTIRSKLSPGCSVENTCILLLGKRLIWTYSMISVGPIST